MIPTSTPEIRAESVAFNAATQSLTYSANAAAQDALAAGQTATDSFSYTVADAAGATSTATVTVTVTGVNDAPVAVADSIAVNENATTANLVPLLLANDTDVDAGDTRRVGGIQRRDAVAHLLGERRGAGCARRGSDGDRQLQLHGGRCRRSDFYRNRDGDCYRRERRAGSGGRQHRGERERHHGEPGAAAAWERHRRGRGRYAQHHRRQYCGDDRLGGIQRRDAVAHLLGERRGAGCARRGSDGDRQLQLHGGRCRRSDFYRNRDGDCYRRKRRAGSGGRQHRGERERDDGQPGSAAAGE